MKVTPETLQKIEELYRSGKNLLSISRELGISEKCIYYVARYYGIVNDDKTKLIRAMVEDYKKMPAREVAKKYGYSVDGLLQIMKCLGVKRRLRVIEKHWDKVDMAKKLYEAGLPVKKVAEQIGLSLDQTLRLLRQIYGTSLRVVKYYSLAKKLIEMLDRNGVVTSFDFTKETGKHITITLIEQAVMISGKKIEWGQVVGASTNQYVILDQSWVRKYIVFYPEYADVAVLKLICEANPNAYAHSLWERVRGPLRLYLPAEMRRIGFYKTFC